MIQNKPGGTSGGLGLPTDTSPIFGLQEVMATDDATMGTDRLILPPKLLQVGAGVAIRLDLKGQRGTREVMENFVRPQSGRWV